jgi:pterin-4a-carbinolamine dehydratase
MAGWSEDGGTLVREFECKDFAGAMGFVNRVADLAEEANQPSGHPHPRLEQGPPDAEHA